MKLNDLTVKLGFESATSAGADREITGVYCCDLLSFAMGRAPKDSAWVTVMGNVNVVAVASLADVSCVVVADGASLDEQAAQKATEQGIAMYKSKLPVFETAKLIDAEISSE